MRDSLHGVKRYLISALHRAPPPGWMVARAIERGEFDAVPAETLSLLYQTLDGLDQKVQHAEQKARRFGFPL
jgi:hypothetical protein